MLPQLNLLGWTSIHSPDIDVHTLIRELGTSNTGDDVHTIKQDTPGITVRKNCQQSCQEVPELFKPEL